MRKKKVGLCCLGVGILVFFVSCKREVGGLLLNGIIQEKAKEIIFIEYQKEDSISYKISDDKEVDKLLEQLDCLSAQSTEDWTNERVELPIYGIVVIQDADGGTYEPHITYGYWSNGYWIDADGQAYQMKLPVEELKEDYAWEEENSFSSITTLGVVGPLVLNEQGWKKELLTEAQPATMIPGLVTAATREGDTLTVSIDNQGEQLYLGDKYRYVIEACLDEVWYELPLAVWSRHEKGDVPAIYPGEGRTLTYSLAVYDNLPAGTYRLVTGSGENRKNLVEFVLP